MASPNLLLIMDGDVQALDRCPIPRGWIVPYTAATDALVGLLVDLARPWSVSRTRGAMVGFVASIPVSLGYLLITTPGIVLRPRSVLLAVLLYACTYGVGLGALLWSPPGKE